MNEMFKPFLRKFVLIFLDNILIFSKSWQDHFGHIRKVLQVLQEHGLVAKRSKCTFGKETVEYLGHVVSREGLAVDPSKVSAIRDWPIPTNVKGVRGFLGITGYYKRFIKGFATLATPLTDLLRKGDTFEWNAATQSAFERLKELLSSAPVLGLPCFDKMFFVETDASGVGIGAVLTQDNRPLAYFSQKLNQKSLRELTQQTIQTPEQQRWLSKLIGYDFEIRYRPGKWNSAADALSREENLSLMALTQLTFGIIEEIQTASAEDPELCLIIEQIRIGTTEYPGSTIGGNAWILRTFHRLSANFYWKNMRKDMRQFVRECQMCQRMKSDSLAPAGLLQPLPIPNQVFEDISLDFITGLPKSNGKEAILVVVDRLTKYGHFFALPRHYDSVFIAKVMVQGVIKLHGIPRSMVSDRDRNFVSELWKELARLQGTELGMSSAYHPQTDGQTKALNRCLEMYLRCLAGDEPTQWERYLAWAEYWYNTTYQASAGMTPFKALYGRDPPTIVDYLEGSSINDQVSKELYERDVLLRELKRNLVRAQSRMKNQADKHRREMELDEGSWAFVRLQPYRQLSLRLQRHQKISAHFFGPYRILKRIGAVAYQLDLPASTRIHPIFHVSQLKPCRGKPLQQVCLVVKR
ncbi:hypothetical protein GQ457_03G025630 [Hibiscus cannabinus]